MSHDQRRKELKRYHFILLAAGYSKRFGSNKLFHEIGGTPLYMHTLRKLMTMREEYPGRISLIVVTQYPEIEKTAEDLGIPVVINPDPSRGISSSFQEGLRYALDQAESGIFASEENDFVCFVADQPYLRTETIRLLMNNYEAQDRGIGCLGFGERLGNPVIFSGRYVEELLNISGDVGGKQVCRRHPEDLMVFQIGDERELADLDVPEDL